MLIDISYKGKCGELTYARKLVRASKKMHYMLFKPNFPTETFKQEVYTPWNTSSTSRD